MKLNIGYDGNFRGLVISLGTIRRICIRPVKVSSWKDKGEYPKEHWGFHNILSGGKKTIGYRYITKKWCIEYWKN